MPEWQSPSILSFRHKVHTCSSQNSQLLAVWPECDETVPAGDETDFFKHRASERIGKKYDDSEESSQ